MIEEHAGDALFFLFFIPDWKDQPWVLRYRVLFFPYSPCFILGSPILGPLRSFQNTSGGRPPGSLSK